MSQNGAKIVYCGDIPLLVYNNGRPNPVICPVSAFRKAEPKQGTNGSVTRITFPDGGTDIIPISTAQFYHMLTRQEFDGFDQWVPVNEGLPVAGKITNPVIPPIDITPEKDQILTATSMHELAEAISKANQPRKPIELAEGSDAIIEEEDSDPPEFDDPTMPEEVKKILRESEPQKKKKR